MTLVDPYVGSEKNTHTMTPIVVSKKSTHAKTLVDPCGLGKEHTSNDTSGSM